MPEVGARQPWRVGCALCAVSTSGHLSCGAQSGGLHVTVRLVNGLAGDAEVGRGSDLVLAGNMVADCRASARVATSPRACAASYSSARRRRVVVRPNRAYSDLSRLSTAARVPKPPSASNGRIYGWGSKTPRASTSDKAFCSSRVRGATPFADLALLERRRRFTALVRSLERGMNLLGQWHRLNTDPRRRTSAPASPPGRFRLGVRD